MRRIPVVEGEFRAPFASFCVGVVPRSAALCLSSRCRMWSCGIGCC